MTLPFNLPKIEIGEDFFRQITVTATTIDLIDTRLSDFREPLRFALEHILIPSVEANFAYQGRPKWTPLAISTIRKRGWQNGPILYRSGTLYDAATSPESWTVTEEFVALTDISSRVSYAAFHQFGTKKMPARPYVEYQPQDVEDITSMFEAWVGGIIEETWGIGEEGPE